MMKPRRVRVWLRMAGYGGGYPVPSSEADYRAHLGLIDDVVPTNGGLLHADGSWRRGVLTDSFVQDLPRQAKASGHRYMPSLNPGHGVEGGALLVVLDNPDCWLASAEQVVDLALNSFDSPWDAVVYDAVGTPPEYRGHHAEFVRLLAYYVQAAGLRFIVAHPGIAPDYDSWHMDLGVIAQIADEFDHYCYTWDWPPKGQPMGPYWWAQACLDNALAHGVPAQRMWLGFANYASYYPRSGQTEMHECTHEQAQEIIGTHQGSVQWVERSAQWSGLVREKRADLGDGHLWFQDADTIQVRLKLADEYDLPGIMLFCPGMGDPAVWDAIQEWRNG